ncbi:hypothetical protein DFH06DRAFT_110722 [Mycena polygramma]|nr:hypothetical protein DFH06DRAFT_110722 [Mycena polygramma]
MLTAPMERDTRIVHVMDPFYAAPAARLSTDARYVLLCIPTFPDNLPSAPCPTPSPPPQPQLPGARRPPKHGRHGRLLTSAGAESVALTASTSIVKSANVPARIDLTPPLFPISWFRALSYASVIPPFDLASFSPSTPPLILFRGHLLSTCQILFHVVPMPAMPDPFSMRGMTESFTSFI